MRPAASVPSSFPGWVIVALSVVTEGDAGRLVVDGVVDDEVDEVAKGPAVPGSVNLVWDRDADTMPLDGLPEDKSVPLFVH